MTFFLVLVYEPSRRVLIPQLCCYLQERWTSKVKNIQGKYKICLRRRVSTSLIALTVVATGAYALEADASATGLSRVNTTASSTTTTTAITCSNIPDQQKATKITYWSSGPTAGVQQYLCGFNREYAGKYFVQFTSIPYATEFAQVGAAIAAHKAPDLMQESMTPSLYYAYEGLEEPVVPLLKLGGVSPNDFVPSRWSGFAVKGVHYAAPVFDNVTVLLYNKALFKSAHIAAPPTTRSEFVGDAEKLTVPKRGQWGFIQDPGKNTNVWEWTTFTYQLGGQLVRPEPPTILFDSTAGQEALQFEKDLIFKYHVSPKGASPGENDTEFLDGKDAMVISASSEIPTAAAALGTKLGVAQVPVIGKAPGSFVGGGAWWEFKDSNTSANVRRGIGLFMGYVYRHSYLFPENQGGLSPVFLPSLHSAVVKRLPYMGVLTDTATTGHPNPAVPNFGTVTVLPLYSDIDSALLGRVSVNAALAQGARQVAAVIRTIPVYGQQPVKIG